MEALQPDRLIISFPTIAQGERGCLTFAESDHHVPFKIERVFWIYDVGRWIIRGGHSHKHCEQVMIAINGQVVIEMNGNSFLLSYPSLGLYVPINTPIKMREFSHDCVLMVLCSHHFSEEDYVRETNQIS